MNEPTPSSTPPPAPAPETQGSRFGSLALAVAIAAAGGFILARLGGEPAPQPQSPNLQPAVNAQLGNIRVERLPSAAVLAAIRASQAHRQAPAAPAKAQAELVAEGVVPASADAKRLAHASEGLSAALRPRIAGCVPPGTAHGQVILQGTMHDELSALDEVKVLQAPPALESVATCAATKLEGTTLPEARENISGPVTLRFDL